MSVDDEFKSYQHWKDPGFFTTGFARWDVLRSKAPRAFASEMHPERVDNKMWYLLSHEDVRAAYMETESFSNADFNAAPELELENIPLGLDPPMHGKYRKLLTPKFTARAIKDLEGHVREFCRSLITDIAPKCSCDFMQEFGVRYPAGVFLGLMGLPLEKLPYYLNLAHTMSQTPPDVENYGAIIAEAEQKISDVFTELLDKRRIDPTDDLPSYLLSCELENRPLTQVELLSICMNLLRGGLDTTLAQLGHIFMHLVRDPALRERIRSEPESVPRIVDEMMRYYSIGVSRRLVVRDVGFAGCPMKAGDRVMLPLAAANRDPLEFDEPNRFNPDRTHNRHLGFGMGIHRCLGLHLARMEMVIALEEWHKAIPNYRIQEGTEPRLLLGDFIFSVENLNFAW